MGRASYIVTEARRERQGFANPATHHKYVISFAGMKTKLESKTHYTSVASCYKQAEKICDMINGGL